MVGLVLVPQRNKEYFIAFTSIFLELCHTGAMVFPESWVWWQGRLKILTSLIMWLLVWRSTTKLELNANAVGKMLMEKGQMGDRKRGVLQGVDTSLTKCLWGKGEFLTTWTNPRSPCGTNPCLAHGTVDSPRHATALYSPRNKQEGCMLLN